MDGWQVPYQRNPYFTGREALLEQVRATFTQGGERIVTQTVSGLGVLFGAAAGRV